MRLDKQAMAEYEKDEILLRDYASDMSTNFLAGKIQGIKEEKLEIAKNCIRNGISISMAATLTGLTEDDIKRFTTVQ